MISRNGRKEIKDIYKQLMNIINVHNQRPIRISTYDQVILHPFSNKIKGSIIAMNRYDGPEMLGFEIILNKIEGDVRHLCISLTPIKVTMELWDNNKKELVKSLAEKFNATDDPFNDVRGLRVASEYKLSKAYARVDEEYGLQFFTNYKYSKLFIEEIWVNLANMSQYADLSSGIIKENYIS